MTAHMNKYFLILIFLSLPIHSIEKEQETLTLATTHWCPYTCADEGKDSNIVGSYVSSILSKHDIKLLIEITPWSRAIKLAEQGNIDGLLTAVHSEAPMLSFTQSPIAKFQVCFFTLKSSNWHYKEPLDIENYSLGVIQDYGYDEKVDQYLAKNINAKQIVALTGNEGTPRLLKMLIKGRIDIIIEDKLVLKWHATKNNIDLSNIENVGCVEAQPFYLALNKHKKSNEKMLNILDKEFSLPENKVKLQNIINHLSL